MVVVGITAGEDTTAGGATTAVAVAMHTVVAAMSTWEVSAMLDMGVAAYCMAATGTMLAGAAAQAMCGAMRTPQTTITSTTTTITMWASLAAALVRVWCTRSAVCRPVPHMAGGASCTRANGETWQYCCQQPGITWSVWSMRSAF